MITIFFLIASLHFASANLPEAIFQRLSTRMTRGYLPETLAARKRAISATVDSFSHLSPELRNAIKARLAASYACLTLKRPVIKIYGQLCNVFFMNDEKPGRIAKQLKSSL